MNGFIFLIVPASICTLILILRDKLNAVHIIPFLWILRWFHFYFIFFACFYPFIFSNSYDLFYLIIILLLVIHWNTFKGECILSYFEKKILDPSYKLGSDTTYHPYTDIIFGYRNRLIWIIPGIVMSLSFSFVLLRFIKRNTKSLYFELLAYIFILSMILTNIITLFKL
jgi:hypothetical protein